MTTSTPTSARRSRAVPAHRAVRGGSASRRTGGTSAGGPEDRADEADRLARALARWYVEALAGRRDVRPLRDLLSPAVLQRVRCAVLRESARRLAGRRTQTAVVTVSSCTVRRYADRFEVAVVVDDGTRATAVAATLHVRGGGWLVSELARPEDGLPALRPPWFTPD